MENIDKEFIQNILLSGGKILLGIIAGVIGLFIALYIIKLLVKLIIKLLNLAQVYKLDAKLNEIEIVDGKKLNINSVKLISTFFKYVLYVILIMICAEVLNLDMISKQISDLISYTPKLVSALVIFIFGLLFGGFVKKGLKSVFDSMDMSGGKVVSQSVFFLILIFVSITALNQAGIDTTIITNNITMILAALLLAFAIAFGLGAKDVVGKLLKTFYARKTYEVGQRIVFKGESYTVDALENISVILKNEKHKIIIPIDDLVENQVQVQDQPNG